MMKHHAISMLLAVVGSMMSLLVSAHNRVGDGITMSRHLITNDLSTVVIMADAQTGAGPFDEEEDDYVEDSDMVMPALGGFSPNQTNDRNSMLLGIPLELTITVYDISDGMRGMEMSDIEVKIWHTDALGVYSAVERNVIQCENTEGQKWARAKQFTDANGQVTFNSIVPGWYGGRALHYHVRLRRAGDTDYSGTTQIFFADKYLPLLQTIYPYSEDTMFQTPLEEDGLFNRMSDTAKQLLTPVLYGNVEDGYTASVSLGLQFYNNGTSLSVDRDEGGGLPAFLAGPFPPEGFDGPPPGFGGPGGPGGFDGEGGLRPNIAQMLAGAGERCETAAVGDEIPAVAPPLGEEDYFQLVAADSEAGGCLVVEMEESDSTTTTMQDGMSIMLHACESTARSDGDEAMMLAGKWRYDAVTSMFHSALDDNYCLQAGHENDPEFARRLRLYSCSDQKKSQHFAWMDQSRITVADTNNCITFRGINGNVGSDPIIAMDCEFTEGSDHWTMERETTD